MVFMERPAVPYAFRVTMYGGNVSSGPPSAQCLFCPAVQVGSVWIPFIPACDGVFVGNLTIKPATTSVISLAGLCELLLINGRVERLVLLACAAYAWMPVWAMLILYSAVFAQNPVYRC